MLITETTLLPADAAPVTVKVEKLVYGGDGLARLDGQILFAPYVLPNEVIEAHPYRKKGDLLRSSTARIVEASPERITPGCPYFTVCGGCHYQHAGYPYQLQQKREILLETLRRLGGIEYTADIPIISGEPWGYRNRAQFHFEDRRIGYQKPGSHELCPIEECPISSPAIQRVLQILLEMVKRPEWPGFLRSLEVFTNEEQVQLYVADTSRPVAARFFHWCEEQMQGYAHGAIPYRAAGEEFRISRGSFFQVNRFLIDTLVDEVIRDAAEDHVLDLYAGVGLFSLPLAHRSKQVTAVERGGPAYRDLEWNSSQSATNISCVKASTEDYLRSLSSAPDLIVADPPRAGLDKAAVQELRRLRTPKLIIVSCDPATLARDLRSLSEVYAIERLVLVDLFPQTYHFETVAHLRLG